MITASGYSKDPSLMPEEDRLIKSCKKLVQWYRSSASIEQEKLCDIIEAIENGLNFSPSVSGGD